MLDKIKALPNKITFTIGLTLLLVVSVISGVLQFSVWSILVAGILWGIAFLFILIASNKRHSRIDK